MHPWTRRLAGLLSGLGLAAPGMAAPPLSAADQVQLDRAVAAYGAGHLKPALAGFEALARRHVPAAEFNLAAMHLRGEVPRPDLARARLLLERSGRGGFITAQVMLGRALESGELGQRDLVMAHNWYELAAEAGETEAQLAMGTAHYLGRGRPKDPSRAAHWFALAAEAGDIGAMYLLASMYEQGDGVERDLRRARYWYAAAARNGDPAAPDKVKEIDARLTAVPG